jgi:pimeloyl-ACP methyl ester carboxylesterase
MNTTKHTMAHRLYSLLIVFLLVPSHALAEAPVAKRVMVNGIEMPYEEQGSGPPVVFVHGAFSDSRVWAPQREAIAAKFRFIAVTQRYFGTDPWPDDGANYSAETHTSDLAAFIRALDIGPVYLVGRSYGGTVALRTALFFPDLVKGVVAQEPSIAASAVTELAQQELLKRERSGLADAKRAANDGSIEAATRLFADWTNDQPGGFDALPPALRQAHLENGRTIALHFAAPKPPQITCEQLAKMQPPVVITTGEMTRPFFKVLAETAHQCIPGSELVQIANARHAASSQNPEAFNQVVLEFLAKD